jgi:signal transduction histidine kinase
VPRARRRFQLLLRYEAGDGALLYLQTVSRLSPLARRHGFDLLIVVGALAAALEVVLRDDPGNEPTTSAWFAAPAVAIVVLTLLARRRYPFAAPASFWLLCAALSFVDGRLIGFVVTVYLFGLAAAYLLGSLGDAVRGREGLLIVLASAAIIVYNLPDPSTGDLILIPSVFALGWLGGFAFRERDVQAAEAEERAAQAEREREAAARLAVAEERARIARELHDIVAHALSVMVLQVGAVRHKLPDTLGEDREALEDVERAGRTALTEMRRLLGAMRERGHEAELEPQPGLDNLGALVDRVRSAGLPVRLRVEGQPLALPRALDLSAYRIVQEGLTNVLKHADASHAEVMVRHRTDALQLEVRDDGRGPAGGDGLGHGLVGIRERVKLYGGEMTAGPANGGGFVLSASLRLTDGPR